VTAEPIARVVADLRAGRVRHVVADPRLNEIALKRATTATVVDATAIYDALVLKDEVWVYEDHPCIAPPWESAAVCYVNEHGNCIVMQVTAGAVDIADGGAGSDTLALVGVVDGDGVVVVDLSSLIDQVTDIGTVDSELLVQKNFEHLDASGLGSSVNATGSGGANIMIGSDGADQLTGNAGNDTLEGGADDDTLNGGVGNDTFLFGLGDGQDLVQDTSGSADKMLFDGGIDPLDLVISRQANDLRLAIHGSSDQITVQNWYASSINRTETIQAGNGEILLSAQVDQLIQAMAGFTQLTGLTWDQAIDQQPQEVQTILAANWQ
jgi:Ca2+-binding RTX toxin-like protein